ncbi:hypothetical protein [Megalodesulfovibrio gigas]|uniref:Uncharacterized protein n=1 Tax=Megalodesulfovibrio gigas (strain ATCC 19364 / DSM 1382 / NCIMB 9332 / VKM B-1759) TaxID=1121448 RepID=T2GAF9_MEGG1|nr:hypothetical protein [Megalodesulfovibrio gigas]AGW13278.1 hypothetical protein DGI_1433 [Megalodesulfovibrio gigas DSM 1382 = ATCC 19364]
MSVFKKEKEFKRVIFNIDAELAERLEKAKEESRRFGKKLDVDGAMDKALEKFLKKAEKKLEEMAEDAGRKTLRGERAEAISLGGEVRMALPSSASLSEQEEAAMAAPSIIVVNN